ncbi:MAG: protein translocase subunit SecD, partial [Thermoguttaceae bacterium]|nr:protein translocase subunit SecD [Thermoguttaceae bacterium]
KADAKAAAPKADAKTEAPKADAKAAAPKADAKAEAPKADAKAEAPKADAKDVAKTQGQAPVSKLLQKDTTQKSNNLVLFLVIAVIFLVSLGLSKFFAKAWRLSEYESAYLLIIFLFLASLISTVTGTGFGGFTKSRMNLGIDLRGGSILVYGVSPKDGADIKGGARKGAAGKNITNEEMGQLKGALARRINPSGVREISIQELGNNTEVKITIPEADEAEVARLERIINSAGQLKFRILVSRDATEEAPLITKALSPELKEAWEIKLDAPIGKDEIILGGVWTPVDPTQEDSIRSSDLVLRDSLLKNPNDPAAPRFDVLVLTLTETYDVYGRHMSMIRESVGQRGDPEVLFSMSADGAERLQRLTNRYKAGTDRSRGRQLGIVMNDSLYSAPTINDTIGRSGVITFGRDLGADSRQRIQREVRDLIQVMQAGALPAKLTDIPVTKMVTGPTLGADTIEKGKNSVVWGGLIVLIFMVMYYGFGGMVASFAVIMNLLLIMTFMLGLRAAFTLPGLAGLVLTVGMAVDANVLIFERIKEEINGGATLKMAVRNGFQKAFSAILDSNVTTMITAAILYFVGTDQVKGFAVTLFLGVAFSLFTATFVSRIIFETCEKRGWITTHCVYPLTSALKPFGKTKINFVGMYTKALWVFNILILIGLLGVFVRGKGIFDIDFVGGVEVQTVFDKEQNISDIRAKLRDLPDLSVSNLSLSKDRNGNPVAANTCFTICTSCPPKKDADEYRVEVEALLKKAFGDALRHFTLTFKNEGVKEVDSVSVPGTKEKKTVAQVSVKPSLGREVVLGLLEDARDALIKEGNVDTFEINVTNDEYKAGKKEESYGSWTVLMDTSDQKLADKILQSVSAHVNETQTFESSNTIGSSVASYARTQGMLAILGSLICIILYIWVRFTKVIYGLASVISLIYNVLFTLGLLAVSFWLAPYFGFLGISEFKIGLPTVAAFLTIIGYSLNDTIVLFDRIREIRGKNVTLTPEIVNVSINQTLSRTVLTSLTTLFVALVLYFFGGAGIHTFSFAMCVGVFIGTLSTIFVAANYLLKLSKMEEKKRGISK